ncbi:hypothetical protein [Bartonella gliris]|uniref:hypothetical protein n=1 Tax=Bartonella gliris TaxID=3004109 RepID=UPI00295E6882|nr:hypothetical protein [Bartonella gliris]
MVKLFKNHVLSIIIATVFSLFQVINVNANYLKNNFQQEVVSVSVEKQGENKAISTTTFHTTDLNRGAKNETAIEGKVERVLEPLTVGIGVILAGHVISAITAFIGWITQIVSLFK